MSSALSVGGPSVARVELTGMAMAMNFKGVFQTRGVVYCVGIRVSLPRNGAAAAADPVGAHRSYCHTAIAFLLAFLLACRRHVPYLHLAALAVVAGREAWGRGLRTGAIAALRLSHERLRDLSLAAANWRWLPTREALYVVQETEKTKNYSSPPWRLPPRGNVSTPAGSWMCHIAPYSAPGQHAMAKRTGASRLVAAIRLSQLAEPSRQSSDITHVRRWERRTVTGGKR